jgi:hypothetical protein
MASLWLPLARYAEDQAHQVGSDTKFFYPNAYKYRDWVIDAFNRDLGYDRFIKLQLAADKMGEKSRVARSEVEVEARDGDRSKPQALDSELHGKDLAALGFLGLGPKYYNRGRLDVMADEWEDRVDNVTRTFLGLTVSCSRCHDHKFDPVTMEDYYALAGVFASTKMVNKRLDGKSEEDKTEADKMAADTLHIVEDGTSQDLNVFIRGNVQRKGPVAERRFLRVLSERDPVEFKEGSGRHELAEAIADPHNPLTARVMVNRLWGAFFGRPLVATPSNFGHTGEQPSHPQLLDDLAVRFMQNGWSVKSMVREFVMSATYRQTSAIDPEDEANGLKQLERLDEMRASRAGSNHSAMQQLKSTCGSVLDPANELLWRMNRRRLTIEQWRDSVLFVSGQLDFSSGKSQELDDPVNKRRTVHARISRLKLNDLLMQFDYPDANVHAEKRSVSTTATQKLFMLNNPFVLAQAQALAVRVTTDRKDEKGRIRRIYQLLFGREPEKTETKLALQFLRQPETSSMSRWEQYAQLLLVSNEMLYVD